jgi:hypothetical protein
LKIKRGARQFIDDVHLQLIVSHGTGELPAILLPNQPGPTLDRALDFTRWLTNELERVGMEIRIHYRPDAAGGLVIAFSDAHPPANSKATPESPANPLNTNRRDPAEED